MLTEEDPSKLLRLLADLFRQIAGRHDAEIGDVLRATSYELEDSADEIDRLEPRRAAAPPLSPTVRPHRP
jgi:hypothetical protein